MAADIHEDEPQATPGTSFSQRLFSEEVAIAQAKSGEPLLSIDFAYEFSNGRRFTSAIPSEE